MSVNLPISAITLNWYCPAEEDCADDGFHPQPLADIMMVGGLICPDCGEDMVLEDATVTGERYPERTLDKDGPDEWTGEALSPAYGDVTIVARVTAVSFGTKIACFKPLDAPYGSRLLEFDRTFDKLAVVR